MSRKVFISVLGTGNYKECTYGTDNFQCATTFIQEATLRMIGADKWDEGDRVYIFCTEGATKQNWNEVPVGDNGLQKDYKGLSVVLKEMQLKCTFERCPIVDGDNEDEIWKIFSSIYGKLNDGDQLYIDITHAFRYQPMLVLVLVNYAKFLKNVSVESLTYGNYEVLKAKKTTVAPIMDLLSIVKLQGWTFAAADYMENGHAGRLSTLASDELKPILKEARGTNENATNLKKFINYMEAIALERQTCRGLDVTFNKNVDAISQLVANIDEALLPLFVPVFHEIAKSISTTEWRTNSDKNCLLAAKWCYEKHLYQQAITFLKESITSYVCSKAKWTACDIKSRDIADAAISIKAYNTKEEEWNETARKNAAKVSWLLDSGIINDQLSKTYTKLGGTRNDFNHAGFRDNATKPAQLINKIKGYLVEVEALWNEDNSEKPERTSIFINLTNHPVEKWSNEQKAAATVYGEPMDMPFPSVSPEMENEEMDRLVEDYAGQIEKLCQTHRITVHLMGEMTFTFRLVGRLKAMGIRCVASTTERVAEEQDGVRTSIFKFVKFREY